jgi:hypothetical protein
MILIYYKSKDLFFGVMVETSGNSCDIHNEFIQIPLGKNRNLIRLGVKCYLRRLANICNLSD